MKIDLDENPNRWGCPDWGELLKLYQQAVAELRAARAVVEAARAGRELGNGGMTEDEYDLLERTLDAYDKVVGS